MKILKKFSLLCIILILSQTIHSSIQQQEHETTDDDLNGQLDPQDLIDYEAEKEARKTTTTTTLATTTTEDTTTTTTTTTESTTTTTELTTTTEEETSTTTKSEETSTRASTVSSSTSTKATLVEEETTTVSSQLRVNEQGFVDVEVKSGLYQEILVEKAATTAHDALTIYSIRSPLAAQNNYQIQMHIDTDAHIDFRSCAISISTSKNITSSENEECIRSYIEIIDSARFSLRIKRDQLPNTVRIKLRTVISGCDGVSKLRDISLAGSTSVPSIYHNSDHECIYRVVNPNNARLSMMKLLVEAFPASEDKVCHAIVEIANGDSADAIDSHDHRLQAKFDSFEALEPFAAGVLVSARYAFIKVVNCYENNEPVEISIRAIKRAATTIVLNEKHRSSRLDSDLVASPLKDSFLLTEIRNENLRNLIRYKLDYIKDAKKDCAKLDRNTSLLTVYGMDDLDNMHVFQYFPCSPTTADIASPQQELNGFKTVYVQFYRETKNPKSGFAADKFLLALNLNVVQTKHIVLTNRASHITSEEFENLDLRNVYFDFEIRAPLGHRIVLNVSKFDNGKNTMNHEISNNNCEDFLLVRLNKTTSRMKSFYEVSHNPIFCASIGAQPVLLSSYTNTLTVSIYLKQLDENAMAEHFIDMPQFEFSYRTEPFCDNLYTRRRNALISFSSLQSMPSDSNGQCNNTISVGADRRIVLYKLDWLEYTLNPASDGESDESNVNFMNGRIACNGSDSLIISDENPKYRASKAVEEDPSYIFNMYCMANPFRSYISDSSRLYMTYKLYESPHKPLVFDLGYFSYKYLYTDFDSRVDIDFSTIIPSNVLKRTVVDSLEVIIRLENKTNYIVPVISDCDFGGGLETGEVVLKTSSRSIPIKNLKCGASEDGERTAVSYTTMLSMESELRVEFRNVRLSELRDKKVRFRIDYKAEPRVFESNAATFETNNFKHDYVSITRDRVEYEWTIKVAINDMIRLRVDELLNDGGVTEWTITDLNENLRYYDQNELIENFKSKRDFTYLFPTNWIRITFKHDRDGNKRRSTSTYPYVRLSYVSEPRIITKESSLLTPQRQEIRLSNSLVKRRIEWLIVGARDHHIVAEIARFSAASKDSNGQIKFSLLGRGYTDNGTYHFNLNEKRDVETRDRVTDLVVSAGNALRVEYLPGQPGDSFSIAYRVLPQVRSEPSGWIRQYFNEITKPEIFVPKLTDQSWLVRAPYSKKIALYVKSMDLLNEEPCSKSRVDFFEANGTRVFSECGNMEPGVFELQHSLALVTTSNELSIHFLTQNTNEVVYSGRIEESVRAQGSDPLDTPADGESYHTYRGFLYFYAFVEHLGDCYFQQRGRHFMCGYESVAGPKWVIAGDDVDEESKSVEQVEFDKTFCSTCYLSAQIPVQTESGSLVEKASILVSPVINKHSLVLKFDYRMTSPAELLVILIHNHDYTDKKFDRSVLIKKIDKVTEGSSWSTVRLRLGTHIMHNFRILFSFEQTNNSSSPSINLDNIEFFEHDYECAVRMDEDETCAAGSSIFSSFKQQKSLANEVCQKYATPCEIADCQNGALCLNKYQIEANLLIKPTGTAQNEDEDEYICVCPYGFTGKKCESRIDPCESNECSKNSRCVGALGEVERGYRCECNTSFTGELCDERVSACKRLENPCNEKTEQGTCVDVGVNEHKCECTPFYTGENCETLLNKHCLNDECRKFDANATCIELADQSYCRCSPGFAGPTCANIDDCKDVPCLNNGTCIDGINSFVCQCTEAFEGKYCELSKKCADCKQPGTLYCKPDEARCVCRETHAGEHCEVELDPCLDKPCGKNGECMSDKVENYECLCHPGFKGRNCELEENICDLGLCQNGATCMLAQDLADAENIGYECQCAPGFEGKNCELLINMCEKENGGCANGGTCLPTPVGNFTCLCPVSHTGRTCEQPVDHCLTAKCAYGSTCHVRLNSYICECPPGKFGRYCDEEQDPCLNNECKNGYCVAHELQADGSHPYTCQCQPGYTGEHCEVEIDDCESSPCENNSTCVDQVGTYKCICPYNYSGKNCESRFELCSQPETRCDLKNTKQCIPIANGIKCDCMPRFTGLRCETPISFCDAFKPCRSGRCVQLADDSDDYECKDCADGYGGKNCSELINFCDHLKPCQNDGVCYAKPNDYFCHCSEKFTGKNCEVKVHPECIHNRCMHGSLCLPDRDSKRGYKCECGADHEGEYCEKKKDKCRDVNCAESGGYCVEGKCECDPKHPLCASECKKKNVVCMNGGKCVDVIKGSGIDAVCMCPPGLTGEFCENSIFCVSNGMRPCGKNSQCKTVNQSYECHCEHPYIGHGCSIKLNDYFPEYENYMNQVRLSAQNEKCRFGRSKESKILIGIIAVGGFTLLVIGLMIGHCSIIAYRKRYEAASSLNKVPNKGTYSAMSSENSSNKSIFLPKTPIRALSPRDMNLNKSSAFSIPRPSVRAL